MISIITTAYNIEKYLPICIDSILAQTYTDFELILVDDESADSSGKICDEYAKKDSRIRVIHQTNKGVSESWNIAVKQARGEYIGFVDGDDFIHPRMYELLYRAVRETQSDVAYCGFRVWHGDDTDIYDTNSSWIYSDELKRISSESEEHRYYKVSSVEEEMDIVLHEYSGTSIWNGLYRSSLVRKFSFIKGRNAQDRAWSPQIILNANKIVRTDCVLYTYRKRSGSESLKARGKRILDHLYVRCSLMDYLIEHSEKWVVPSAIELFTFCIDAANRIPLLEGSDQKEQYRLEIHHALEYFSRLSIKDILDDPYTKKKRKMLAIIGKISFPLSCVIKRNLLKIVNH